MKLENEQFRVLSEGHALYLPENDRPASRHLLYCMADSYSTNYWYPVNRSLSGPTG